MSSAPGSAISSPTWAAPTWKGRSGGKCTKRRSPSSRRRSGRSEPCPATRGSTGKHSCRSGRSPVRRGSRGEGRRSARGRDGGSRPGDHHRGDEGPPVRARGDVRARRDHGRGDEGCVVPDRPLAGKRRRGDDRRDPRGPRPRRPPGEKARRRGGPLRPAPAGFGPRDAPPRDRGDGPEPGDRPREGADGGGLPGGGSRWKEMKLSIGIPREIKEGENRVATTPRCVRALREAGARVLVQKGAGLESGFPDSEFARGGATIVPDEADAWSADLVVKVKEPLPREFRFLSDRTALFTYLHLAAFPKLTDELVARKVTAIAYETVTRDGRLPLLRPMSEVAGILSVQVGARGLEKASGGRGVLLSPVTGGKPATVCVIGAGIAGRNAARTAAGIGARVTVLDISREKLARVREETGGRGRTGFSTPVS